MKTLKVVKVENGYDPQFADKRIDKNGKPYTYVQVSSPSMILAENELGEKVKMRVEPKISAFTAYRESYLLDANGNPTPQYGHDFQVGELVPGDIVTRKVEKYFIENENGKDEFEGKKGRWVDIASVIVFGDSDSPEWELKVQQAFKRGRGPAGFQLVDNSPEALAAQPSKTMTRNIDQQIAGQPNSGGDTSQNSTSIIDRQEDLVEHEADTVATHGDTGA